MKNFIIILFTIFLGVTFGVYIYKGSKIESSSVFNETNKAYLLQYGVYTSIDSMKDNTRDLSDYFFYKDKDGYHAIIGVVENKNLSDKIRESYDITSNIYIKEVNIDNMEFIENLRQYDNLISSYKDSKSIINAEKQILSKYEELVLNNE